MEEEVDGVGKMTSLSRMAEKVALRSRPLKGVEEKSIS